MQDGHVLLVAIQGIEPAGQLVLVEAHFKGLLLFVLLEFFVRKRRQPKLIGQVAIRLAHKDKAMRSTGHAIGWRREQLAKRRGERQAGGAERARLEKFASIEGHLFLWVYGK